MSQSKIENQNSIVARAIIISTLVLTGLFVVLFFLEGKLAAVFGKFSGHVITGLMLFTLWLVVSGNIRSIYSLEKSVANWKLMLAGVLTGGVGAVLYSAFLIIFPRVAKSGNPLEVAGVTGGMIALFSVLSFLISLLTLINIRLKNRWLGHVLEFVIIAGSIFLFIYFIS